MELTPLNATEPSRYELRKTHRKTFRIAKHAVRGEAEADSAGIVERNARSESSASPLKLEDAQKQPKTSVQNTEVRRRRQMRDSTLRVDVGSTSSRLRRRSRSKGDRRPIVGVGSGPDQPVTQRPTPRTTAMEQTARNADDLRTKKTKTNDMGRNSERKQTNNSLIKQTEGQPCGRKQE